MKKRNQTRGRPLKGTRPAVIVCSRIPPEVLDQVDAMARNLEQTRSEFLSRVIEDWFATEGSPA